MNNLLVALFLVCTFGTAAQAQTEVVTRAPGLEFVTKTRIPGADETMMSLCYVTDDLVVFGIVLTSDVQGYALASDGCETSYDQLYSEDKIVAAQALGLIPAEINPVAGNDWKHKLGIYGLLLSGCLGLIAVIIRRVKSLLGYDLRGPMRKKAALRILSAMCHMAKCDGIVDSIELTHIRKTIRRLTGRNYPTSEVIQMVDSIDMSAGLDEHHFIAFGKGLRDREKDLMMQGILSVAIASGRLIPVEHAFATELAYGLGIPGEDFRRLLDLVYASEDAA
ncbi:TerB family tellurite resistance protein [Loktanella sp. D2R18]|uniref:tellurite resistance TerB family protein n=1 Tax=Rhodobacterales TaxID=204455 RepID=UPI000DEAE560|nr:MULTISPECIES: TerB family tellurite resistance protein [Rhodobacterales]MDO6588669.1 TerB family tellurite resistance protein [Yoonia sp. 1_MG-2023]RBW42083.1 TerB family tellurite resistance protein [Loktanella sp. D2R18]